MVSWPENLVREVGRRRAFFFLGAGVSASACNDADEHPETWGEFLSNAISLINEGDLKNEIEKLIEENKYLLALQAIKDNADPGDYDQLLSKSFNNPAFKASKLHELIFELDLETVLTTNFDKIYESYCHQNSTDGYRIQTYKSEGLGDLIRSDTKAIIKAHGCINETQSMIFTKAQYHAAKRDYPQFYDLLKAIFLTHTCIFIGCSLDDPDILLTLEDVNITSSSKFHHFMLSKNNNVSEICQKDLKETYNIKVLEYGSDHSDLTTGLQELLDLVLDFRGTYVN
jgi:hypothetical protein